MKMFRTMSKALLLAVFISSQSNALSILAQTVPSAGMEHASPSNASLPPPGKECSKAVPSDALEKEEKSIIASGSNALEETGFFHYAIPGEVPGWYTLVSSGDEDRICYTYTDRDGTVQWRTYGSWGDEDYFWYPCSAYGIVKKNAVPVTIRYEDNQSNSLEPNHIVHNYGEWTIKEEPTCTTVGQNVRTCTVCGAYDDIADIPALGHSVESWEYKRGSCPAGITLQGTCTRCLQTIWDEKTADHTWTEWYWASAPCSTTSHTFGQEFMAYKRRNCQICGAIETGETIFDPIGHEFNEWTLGSAPTCAKTGYEERYCKYYGTSPYDCLGYETRTLPKTEHTWSESSKTASVNGYWQTYCDVCGEVVQAVPITYKVRFYINPELTEYVEEEHTYGASYYLQKKDIVKWYEEKNDGWSLTWNCPKTNTSYDPYDEVRNLTKEPDEVVEMIPIMTGKRVAMHLYYIYSLNPDMTCYGRYYEPMVLPERKRTGYTLLYWSDSWPEIGNTYQNGDQIDFYNDKTLYEVWEPNQYTLTFVDEPISGILNNGVPEHIKPTKTYYYEYHDDNFGNPVTIYLHYDDITAHFESYKNLPGLTFLGVYTQPEGKGTKVSSASKIWAENRTLYPYFRANEYSLVFDEDYRGGGGSTQMKHYYDSMGPLPAPTREGYTFKGWYTEKGGKGSQITAESKMPAKTTWCYAYWEENEYSVTYSLKDETPVSQSQHKYSEITYTESEGKAQEVYQTVEPDAYKYNLTTWSTNTDGTGQAFAPGTQISKLAADDNAAVKLYANWKGKPMKLHLDPNGSVNESSSVNGYYNEPIGDLPEPDRPGYAFRGWNTTADHDGDTYTKDSLMPYSETGQTDLYASWSPNEYKVTLISRAGGYSSNGAPEYKDRTEEILVEFQDNCAGTALSYGENGRLSKSFDSFGNLPGLVFEGFYTGPEGQGSEMGKDSLMLPQDLTLYANYTQTDYTVTYDSCFDPEKNVVKVFHYYDPVGELPQIDRPGYTLEGWYTEKEGKGQPADPDARFGDRDAAYYADWIPNTYTITYDYGIGKGDTADKKVVYGTLFGTLPEPSVIPEDFVFCGWYTVAQDSDSLYGDAVISEDYRVTEKTGYRIADDCVLYAYYKAVRKEPDIADPDGEEKPVDPDPEYPEPGCPEPGLPAPAPSEPPVGQETKQPESDQGSSRPSMSSRTDSAGHYITFWVLNDKHWYYYDPKGHMATSQWVPYRNRLYWLRADGIMLSNTWFEQDGNRYLLTDNGAMAQSEWSKKDGLWYYFDEKGHISDDKDEISSNFKAEGGDLVYTGPQESLVSNWYEEYYINGDNTVLTNQWIQEGEDWYYVGTNGKKLRGQWNEVDGLWYYMNPDGKMERYGTVWEGNWYFMDRNGACYNTNFNNISK
ncbi:hypothetical protein GPL15_23360 [Clostridium sp. MCC353]|uniref:InlB B-repeat-containing protein n=1 Tax=Clostridium sp. MCC353 TaxID=2592646 RepID=UPI001C020AAA|nr:InlB B-repeat-containing protein [Clostridium sp. MCC353]MBT9779420.1 hypothetical protein [Clostridium sp. MCC353]